MKPLKQQFIILLLFVGFLFVFSLKLGVSVPQEQRGAIQEKKSLNFQDLRISLLTDLGKTTRAPVPHVLFRDLEKLSARSSQEQPPRTNPPTLPRQPAGYTSSGSTILAYPAVARDELYISAEGAGSRREFIERFLLAEKDRVQITSTEYTRLMKDKNGIVLFPVALIEHAWAENDFAGIHNSLAILKSFFQRQEERLRMLPVSESGIGAGQYILGFNRLTVQLIEKALGREQNTISSADFSDYFISYKQTQKLFQREMQSAFSLGAKMPYSPRGRFVFLWKLSAPFLRIPGASAQGLIPFGGLIVANITAGCECTGFIIVVQDAATQGVLRLVLSYVSQFLLLGGANPSVGQRMLGRYLPGAGICLAAASECASGPQQDGLIIAPPTGTN
ncbi:MAG: hypothetical protein G01um101466_356 [Parcubacteria group bacterium Gr01-1014_66]|nr:MAG: hypothetical protein G01um101466_356 [Parcubacteria group bacterium Gr01-1014_66]